VSCGTPAGSVPVEDAWGAGAVIGALALRGFTGLSPEAEFARAAYDAVRGREASALLDCASGRELVASGYRADVEIAGEIDGSRSVPLLRDGRFVNAQ
jgi:2-phosphosulfolactate phosphatase